MNVLREGLSRYFSKDELERLSGVRVGIAGAGGLGSNCAQMLVRSGFGKLVLADFDTVEAANLNRQFFFPDQVGMPKVEALRDNLLRLNPDLEIQIFNGRIERDNAAEVFASCEVMVEAFDQAEYKKMLIEAFYSSECFYVAASGIGGWGDGDAIVTQRLRRNFFLIGDNITESNDTAPPCAPRVNIAAAKQANLVLAYALGHIKEN